MFSKLPLLYFISTCGVPVWFCHCGLHPVWKNPEIKNAKYLRTDRQP
jgi:hypothetical protein